MFLSLLAVTFIIAAICSLIVAQLFDRPIKLVLQRIVGEELGAAWQRYLKFAIYVVGVSSGVRIWELEQYINPSYLQSTPLTLNADRWALEVYRTVIATLGSIAGALLAFFACSLIAYVIVRGFELRHHGPTQKPT